MSKNQNYALIDNSSGFVWWVGDATSPEAACARATLAVSERDVEYVETLALGGNETGYHVHLAPAGYACLDWQDDLEIDYVCGLPLIGMYRAIS